MQIEITQPELEAMIEQRMASGRFQSVEEVLLSALKSSAEARDQGARETSREGAAGRKSLAQIFAESPFRGLELEFPRDQESLRQVEL